MAVAVRAARPEDLPTLREIERAAGERYRDFGLDQVADDEPPSIEILVGYAKAGRVWVAVDGTDEPLGYVLVDVIDGAAHIEQVSVLPDHQGHGLGKAMIDRVRRWSAETGRSAVTLTTFDHIPWNRPLYEHLGFRVLTEPEIGPGLRMVRDTEAARGLDPTTRVIMRSEAGAAMASRGHTDAMSRHQHDTRVAQDEDSWNERYRSSSRVWSGNPNAQLVAEIADLEPGRALDVGCGEGADAIWLARRGWNVVGTDISSVALGRAAQHARSSDPKAAARIEWRQADLLVSPPEPDCFDLVSAQFMQLPPEPRARLFTALAASVRAGGTLLVVGHHLSDLATGVPRPQLPNLFYSADEVAGFLDGSWHVVVNEARPRPATTPDGGQVTIHDAVLRATRPTVRR